MKYKKLLLFDIDGTLIKVEGSSRTALIQSLRNVFGTEGNAATHNLAGKMDGGIIREILSDAGFSKDEIEMKFHEVKRQYIDTFKQKAVREDIRVLPGVESLLKHLHTNGDILIALLTGNFEESGRHKLHLPGLNHFFSFGAFADDAERRPELVPHARKRAKEKTGIDFDDRDVIIIGDTEHDITCALSNGIRVMAVATGAYSFEQLQSYQPTITVENLSNTEAISRFLLNGH
ncbi:MAG: HAD family hydrolase [Chloroherpetonaceae bacterium]|nr:HAD family hydrolase [Chloroherpetonaceae bacterium]